MALFAATRTKKHKQKCDTEKLRFFCPANNGILRNRVSYPLHILMNGLCRPITRIAAMFLEPNTFCNHGAIVGEVKYQYNNDLQQPLFSLKRASISLKKHKLYAVSKYTV